MSSSTAFPSKQPFATYKSPFAPKYTALPNYRGLTIQSVSKVGARLGAFGGMAGFFALFFFSDIPRLNRDVMVNIPLFGGLFVKEPLPASDNPF